MPPLTSSSPPCTGDPFDAEIPPRITAIHPRVGSLAGGTDLTVTGTGFGSDPTVLAIDVAGVPCDVRQIQTTGVHCRLRYRPTSMAPSRPTPTAAFALGNGLGSYAGERGVRWQWQWLGANATAEGEGSMLLPSFTIPGGYCGDGEDDDSSLPAPPPSPPAPPVACASDHGSSEPCCGQGGGAVAPCYDIPGFTNGGGYGCNDYETRGWCASGGAVQGNEWTLGAQYQYPEQHCCACGGGSSSPQYQCPASAPYCSNYVHGSHLGVCQPPPSPPASPPFSFCGLGWRELGPPGATQLVEVSRAAFGSLQSASCTPPSLSLPFVCASLSGNPRPSPPLSPRRQGWFEAPTSATYIFMLHKHAASTLTWSGNDTAVQKEVLASLGLETLTAAPPPSAPLTRSAQMSSTYSNWAGSRCIDGNIGSACHSACNEASTWISIDLSGAGILMSVDAIQIYNRFQNSNRLGWHQIWVGTSNAHHGAGAQLCADQIAPASVGPFDYHCDGMIGTHVTVLLPGASRCLSLNEIIIDAAPWVPPPPAWPSWPQDATSPGVSRPVALIGGHRYWMQLECTVTLQLASAACGVGTRILAPNTPRAASLSSPARRWQPRAASSEPCSAISDKHECCATIDANGDACVPAVTAFAGGAVCTGWSAHSVTNWIALQASSAFATCPVRPDAPTMAAQPRVKLALGTPCSSVTDRAACCSAIDGRADGPQEDAPCVPAVTAFGNGAVCESVTYSFASEVDPAQSAASCAELGGDIPLTTPFGHEARVATEVQRLTFASPAPSKLVQQITLTRADCTAGLDCAGGSWHETFEGAVSLQYGSHSSAAFPIHATAAQISAALLAVPDRMYADANVSSISSTSSTLVWTIELTLPFASCLSPPARSTSSLLQVGGDAKVFAQSVLTAVPTCLDGGIDISMTGGSVPSVFVPSDATPDVLATSLNELIGATSAADGVLVTRSTEGGTSASSFTITFLSGGAKPLLQAVSSASRPLLCRTFHAADMLSSTTSTDVSATFERVVPGGIDLLPIPGRYLSAPTDHIALRLRLERQTTARCAAPNWDVAHLGCFGDTTGTNGTAGTNGTLGDDVYAARPGSARRFTSGFSLERCALYCQSLTTDAVAFGAELDLCTCLSAASLLTVQSLCTELPTHAS